MLVASNGKVIGGSETDVRARQILERFDIEALEETVEKIEKGVKQGWEKVAEG